MDHESYSIRNTRPDDAKILAQAEREIAKVPGRLASRPEEIKDEKCRDKIISISKNDSSIFLVIEKNKSIVGHAILEPHILANVSHVVFLTIAIHEGHQGMGLGKLLMQKLIEWAQLHPKIEKVELQVRSSNIQALALYKNLGFVEEGRKTKRLKYGVNDYLDDIYMALWVGNE